MFLSSFHHSAGRALRRGPVRGPSALAHHGCQCTPLICGGDAGRRAECGRLVWWGGNAMVGGSSVLHLPYFIFSFFLSVRSCWLAATPGSRRRVSPSPSRCSVWRLGLCCCIWGWRSGLAWFLTCWALAKPTTGPRYCPSGAPSVRGRWRGPWAMGIFLFLGIFLFSFQLQMGVLLLESAAYHPPGCIYIYPRGGVSRGRSLGRTWVVSAFGTPQCPG